MSRAQASRPLDFAARHISASAREPIGADALLAALLGDVVPPEHEHHVQMFFDEIEVEALSDLARSGAVTYAILARKAERCLASDHETRRWLDERA